MTIKCPNCNSELDNDMKFCINCGQKIEMVETNQNREQQNKENSEAQTSNLADAPAKPEKDALPKKTFKLSKKAVTVGGVFVALV
ncbi:MAG TPA: zinc ribbon domain-containing protein [Bacillota bacterium]|nr:zinc ribbon domain-containing protein [Bacillota bacterium]HOK69555.1 zinc ribbon domain-containing protein [Bacillota bacterium]HPP85949.1 zinc ribbon domain-containing protein [Bacillota bacterium]